MFKRNSAFIYEAVVKLKFCWGFFFFFFFLGEG